MKLICFLVSLSLVTLETSSAPAAMEVHSDRGVVEFLIPPNNNKPGSNVTDIGNDNGVNRIIFIFGNRFCNHGGSVDSTGESVDEQQDVKDDFDGGF